MLWKRSRPTMDPAAAALGPAWPRGLPIQCLFGPVNVAVESAFTHTPFIAKRAVEVVMADPAVALGGIPDDKETRSAIGQFIDNYSAALTIYIMQCSPGHERDRRAYEAWSHALNKLSRRLSTNEAEAFWRAIFNRAQPQTLDAKTKVNNDYPVIPANEDPQQPFEWNPAALIPPSVESRELSATFLDCMLEATPLLQWSTRHNFRVPTPKTQASLSPPIMSYERLKSFRKMKRPIQEGTIATALLLESSKVEGSKLMASPFPSENNVRYPSLFLDHDFLLSSHASSNSEADVALSCCVKSVPSTLLLDLAQSALSNLSRTPSDSTELASVERTAYRLLKVLSKGDRPQLASFPAIRTVLNYPDASSWHRQLLTKSLMRNLSAAQARDMISLFTSSIIETLEYQKTLSENPEKTKASPSSPARRVKVTTVKFMAQFLNDADFVSPRFCVETLSTLFQKASHVDIRVAVLGAMLSRLSRSTEESSDALVEKLTMTIPVIGSLNERKPMQELDWTEAEETGKLPEVYDDGGMQAFPPLLDVMADAMTRYRIASDILRKKIISRIMLPIIEKSIEQSARWVNLFALKHLSSGRSLDVPYFPVRPFILVSLIEERHREVPEYILDLYQEFFLINVSPPADLLELNDIVKSDVELQKSNEGQFWLSLYGKGADVPTRAISSMLTRPCNFPSSHLGRISIFRIQELVLEQADALIRLADDSFHHWNDFIAELEPPLSTYHSDQTRKAWSENVKPVILRIIEKIDTLRTPAWQRDPNRQPAVLPPTFGLRLWLLDYPQLSHQSPDACDKFAQQLISILHELLNLGLAHHAQFDEVAIALAKCSIEDSRRVANNLGSSIDSFSSSHDNHDLSMVVQFNLLKVELADVQLRKVKLPLDKEDQIGVLVRGMLVTWRESEVEEIRMRGRRLGRELGVLGFGLFGDCCSDFAGDSGVCVLLVRIGVWRVVWVG